METVSVFTVADSCDVSSRSGVLLGQLNRYRPPMARPLHVRRPATLASLAAELGVSRTTVSNAYNRPDQLSPELRRRVLETARRLGYPGPDPVARSLRTRHAGAVGLLLTEALAYAFRDPAALRFLEGLALACEEAGRGLLLVPAASSPMAAASGPVSTVHSAAVDGFIVYSVPDDDPHLAAVLQRSVPTVVCDQPVISGVDLVGIDDETAMRVVTRHVLDLGHRRIGVLCMRLSRDCNAGPLPLAAVVHTHSHVQRARLSGLRAALADAETDPAGIALIACSQHTHAAGESGAAALLDHDPQLTAIVCTSDVLALGALAEAARRHIDVPEALTVTGFDGVAEAERAGLTTIRQPMLEKGHTAGRLLFDGGHGSGPRTVILETELAVGRTCAPPRRSQIEWFSAL
jgi:DNA-binding LacI/PurR family transcriptional regulator